jgi:serine/threonine protein kinase
VRGCEVATQDDATPDTPDTARDTTPAGSPDGAVDAATRGLDAVLGREVAMVTLPPARGEDLVVRTEQVRRLAGLHHGHLVEVFDVDGLAEGVESTLVLQSVDGRPVDGLADRGRWSPLAVAEIGAQLASGLAHAHARGVVHGRIGPASVVVGGTPGAPYAWLTGFTAALHPVAPADPAAPPTAPPHPGDDVADLGRTLTLVLDAHGPGAPALEQDLAAMADGRVAARTAAESLAHVAETLRHADDDPTSIVPLVAPEVGTPVAAAPRPTPAPSVDRTEDVGSGRRARRRRHARGLPFAALGGAALLLATASGFVLWAAERPSGPEIGVSNVTRPEQPPAAVAPPATAGPSTGGSASSEDDDEATPVRSSTRRSTITRDVTTVTRSPRPVAPVVPPAVPPTATVPPTTDPADPTVTPTTTTRAAPRTGGAATLAAP